MILMEISLNLLAVEVDFFDPVFEYINREKKLYDGCIYLTDGFASEPKVKPRCKVFWIITPDGKIGPHLKYGRAVKLNS